MNVYLFWISIEIKHFIADYFLQPGWLYEYKRDDVLWKPFLLLHSIVVALPTQPLVWFLSGDMATGSIAFFIDFLLHAVIDRGKLKLERYFSTRISMIIDQSLHQATYMLIFYLCI